jgi:hypothetical protein
VSARGVRSWTRPLKIALFVDKEEGENKEKEGTRLSNCAENVDILQVAESRDCLLVVVGRL